MKSIATQLLLALLFATLGLCENAREETLERLLNRFDADHDQQLDAGEFARVLKAAGVRTVTPAGAARTAAARDAVNAFLSEPRYKARAEKAEQLINWARRNKSAITPSGPLPLDPILLVEDLDDLSTYDRFIVNRAILDQRIRLARGAAGERTLEQARGAEVQNQEPVGMDAIASFLENNFRIRDDMEKINDDAGDDEAAKFSWTKPRGENSYYAVDAAVLYTPKWLDWNWTDTKKIFDKGEIPNPLPEKNWIEAGRVQPSFEAHVSTQDGANRNQLAYALPIQGRMKWFPLNSEDKDNAPFVTGHDLALVPTYITDRAASIRTLGVDAKYQPSVARLNLNHDSPRPVPGMPWLEWSIEGGIGTSFRSIDHGTVVGMADDYGVFTGLVGGKLVFFRRLKVRAIYSSASTLWGEVPSHDLLIVNAELFLDERNHFSVGASYVNGEEEPVFEKVDSITGWVGVKF